MEAFLNALNSGRRRNRYVLTNKFLPDQSTQCQPTLASSGTGGAVMRGGWLCLCSCEPRVGGGGAQLTPPKHRAEWSISSKRTWEPSRKPKQPEGLAGTRRL